MSTPIRVSVITSIFNAEPFLPEFLESFLSQTLGPEATELIAVDDGSTDGSGALLDEFADRHDNITVIHQENSGWPGKPRNVGLDAARGDYVFFADPDDEFGGPEALERLVDFADEHGSDVVVPKMVPKGNRAYAQWRYKTTQIDGDLVTCFTTLTPQKLFRRSFLTAEGIRFPEEKVRLEDGQFLSRAYLLADRVSILTGYDFYCIIHHPEQRHLSSRAVDPENYIGSVAVMSENVENLCSDDDLADRIINEIYFRKVLANFTNSRVAGHSPALRQAWLENQQTFVD
ncbi:glycosyltransferase family 2 protein, partial [Brevibacterium casei]|uniref:glycosyltransferase family 2 protein n=1 Tax=Brevibacterium casei TaxID=33889 RepID=UPI0011A9B1ED